MQAPLSNPPSKEAKCFGFDSRTRCHFSPSCVPCHCEQSLRPPTQQSVAYDKKRPDACDVIRPFIFFERSPSQPRSLIEIPLSGLNDPKGILRNLFNSEVRTGPQPRQ